MGKSKQTKLYARVRSSGVRKKVAHELSELTSYASKGNKAPKHLRETVDRLEATVSELRGHIGRGDRQAAARKAARTRRAKAKSRSASASRGARKRTKS